MGDLVESALKRHYRCEGFREYFYRDMEEYLDRFDSLLIRVTAHYFLHLVG